MTRRASLRVHPDVVFQKLGDEAVLLNLRTGVYWGLNPTGARIWDEIVQRGELAEVVAALQREFDSTETEIQTAVRNLLADLSREGLVVVDESG